MFNILLDRLPDSYAGYRIDPDFQVGIQIMQALEDESLTEQERMAEALRLLYPEEDQEGGPLPLPDAETACAGLSWFLNGWSHDNHKRASAKEGADRERVTDYDVDQWRIYAAFRSQYGIDLNRERLHFWVFMALLTTLDECAYTRVVDIRMKKLTGKMPAQERKAYLEAKRIYALKPLEKTREYTEEEKDRIDAFDRMRKSQLAVEEFGKMKEDGR